MKAKYRSLLFEQIRLLQQEYNTLLYGGPMLLQASG